MLEKTRGCRPDSAPSCADCGQKTTVLRTAAQRQSRVRRCALLARWLPSACLFGCSTFVTATPLHPPPRPLVPRDPASVQVLASDAPAEPHVDVALLEVEQQDGLNRQGSDYMIQRLREKAAELGCDAVFLESASEHDGHDAYLDPDARGMLASCIVFTPPNASSTRDAETADTRKLQLSPPTGQAQP
jgi:hypothetical protein